MSITSIQTAISQGNFSVTELNQLAQFIQGVKCRQAKVNIRVGDSVFVVQKTKRTPGIVEQIKIKKAIVSMRGARYNVPLSMLEPA